MFCVALTLSTAAGPESELKGIVRTFAIHIANWGPSTQSINLSLAKFLAS